VPEKRADKSQSSKGEHQRKKEISFNQFNIEDTLMTGIQDLGFEIPTPIQEKVIPLISKGCDIIGLANTGTGKTAAFLIPIMNNLIRKNRSGLKALILTPTRELAQQIEEQILGLGYHTRLQSVAIYGGVEYGYQEDALEGGVELVVATPGRLIDHIRSNKVNFSNLEFLVIDEADRMYDMGFLPDLNRIIRQLPSQRQSLLFSATMPAEIKKLIGGTLKNPEQIKIGNIDRAATSIEQVALLVDERNKRSLLVKILQDPVVTSALVFSNSKKNTQNLAYFLQRRGIKVECIHSGRQQEERTDALNKFRSGTIQAQILPREVSMSQGYLM